MDKGIRVARIVGALLLFATVILVVMVEAKRPDPAAGATLDPGRRFDDVPRYVFVPGRNERAVTVIDKETDRVAGTLSLGFVPEQVVVSESTAKLVAIDGTTPRMSIVELASGKRTEIELAFTPHRLIGSTDGYMLAAADLSVGTVAFVELARGREVSRVTGLSSIRDLMFGADAAFLYVAAEGLTGIGVVDVARGKLVEEISVPNLRPGGVTGLTRSPSGRIGYVKTRGQAAIALIDLRNFRPIGRLDAALDAGKAFPTGTGGYLVVPDNSEKIVTIISHSSLAAVAMLAGTTEMTTVYSGWFDTIALVPSSTERKLLVYDLDRLARAPDVALPGKPGPGAVTPDGAKLFVALEGAKQVAVIDLRTRQLARTIPVGSDPAAAIMGRSFDICH